jgi:hypothetical protein
MADTEAQGRELKPEEIQQLKQEHGELHQLDHLGYTVVVKIPSRAAWKRYRHMMFDDRKQSEAPEALLRECIVWPSRDEVERMLLKRPGLSETFGGLLMEICGGKGELAEKKAL